ncbi:P2X purinoceptor 7-like [Hydractinia symbiolongicarpus]|uniref:P2X purinoceptor 7-like n=1 Tax=Hydractinia symbiolongicarpus TaxID=13093 RepID=UPI00254BCEA7|nr:P2X purinoceptor 7-like [Hydractinia symbiolongicarpus]
MSSSSSDVSDVEFNEDEEFGLSPFMFEPERSQSEVAAALEALGNNVGAKNCNVEAGNRVGNVEWCQCKKCKIMVTETESLCCRDNNDIPDGHFQGHTCVTNSDEFKMVCLPEPVLRTALGAIHNMRGIRHKLCNRSYWFAAYKQYIWWVYGRLGIGYRKPIPSCVVWVIRNEYPQPDGVYVPYTESGMDLDT